MSRSAAPQASRAQRGAVSPALVRDAALTLFAERGYHGTAVSEIAELLRIRTPSLYNHMSSKQGLLGDIVRETTEQVWRDYEEAIESQPDVESKLRSAVYVYALRHATHRREALIVNRDISSLEEPELADVLDLRRRHEHAVRSLVEEGIASGIFVEQPASLVSFAVLEMCVSIARWFRPNGEFGAEEVAEQYSLYALRMAKDSLQ